MPLCRELTLDRISLKLAGATPYTWREEACPNPRFQTACPISGGLGSALYEWRTIRPEQLDTSRNADPFMLDCSLFGFSLFVEESGTRLPENRKVAAAGGL